MKIIFESDGSDADLHRLFDLMKRMTGKTNVVVEIGTGGEIASIQEIPTVEKKRRGRPPNATGNHKWKPKTHKPADPMELVKQGWQVGTISTYFAKGGHKYQAMRISKPGSHDYHRYTIGKEITKEQAHALIDFQRKPAPVNGKDLSKLEQPLKSCQICLQQKPVVGSCDKMKAPHCTICHNDIHSELLDNFKPLAAIPIAT